MVCICYSSSPTCLAFVAALLRLLLFAVLCHLLLWGHKTTPGWFYHPEGGGFNKGGGFIPQKGWLYSPKGVVLSPLKVGIKPPGVVLRVVLSPIWGWFYARAHESIVGMQWLPGCNIQRVAFVVYAMCSPVAAALN